MAFTVPFQHPRRINDTLSVETVRQRLASYAYAETRLMEAQASWLPYIPYAELKIEWGYQLHQDALHIQAMRERLPEVGWFSKEIPAPTPRLERFFNELTNTSDEIEQLAGLYWVLRPALTALYREQLAQEDTVANQPTARILEQAAADHEAYTAWGKSVLEGLLGEDNAARQKAFVWAQHLRAVLHWAGGILGESAPVSGEIKLRDDSAGYRFRMDMPVRDSRFRVEPYNRQEGRAATDVWDSASLLNYMFMMVEGEIEATESCARTLYDFPEAPWALRLALARQLWDEARHAELSLQRFFEMGGTLDLLPVRDNFPLYFGPTRNQDLGRRLAHLNQIVEGWVTDDFAMMVDICHGLGDERTAHLFGYLIADEWGHIKIGGDWIPRLTQDDPQYRQAVIDYRLEAEQELYDSLSDAAAEVAQKRRPIFGQTLAKGAVNG
jgi:hypothetical protein